MKLVKAQVTNFRAAEDTGEFKLDHVACLVGKNEAGKSAVLTALAALRPHQATPIKLDKERDYPRRYLTQYAERHGEGQATAITTWWELDDGDKAYVAAKVIEETAKSLAEDEGLTELERARVRRDLQKTRELLFQLHSRVHRD